MEMQEHSNYNLEKEEQNQKTHTSDFQNLLQNYSNQACTVVLIQMWTLDQWNGIGNP